MTCAREGVATFGLRLEGAAPSSPAALVLGITTLGSACGSCTLVPNPIVVLPATTDASGNSTLAFTVPAGAAGQTLMTQWLVAAPGGCATFGATFADARAVTFQ